LREEAMGKNGGVIKMRRNVEGNWMEGDEETCLPVSAKPNAPGSGDIEEGSHYPEMKVSGRKLDGKERQSHRARHPKNKIKEDRMKERAIMNDGKEE
jgi:hypothetical protein